MGVNRGIAEEAVDQAAGPPLQLTEHDDVRVAAFERLASQQLDASYGLARAILGRSGDAEDAVHDAFETAWHKWPSLRDPARFEAWFGRIVVNTCRDRLRREARRRTEVLDPQAQATIRWRERRPVMSSTEPSPASSPTTRSSWPCATTAT